MPPNHHGPCGGQTFVCRLRIPNVSADEFSSAATGRLFTDKASQYRLRALLEGLLSLTARPAAAIEDAEPARPAAPFLAPGKGGVGDGQ